MKLGYGGTKEEMERLLAEAEKLPKAMGRDFDISNYADIVDAIHLVQDSMGIAGTTVAEAELTIQGSLSAAKSAWTNLVTGIADENANMEVLISNFVESVSTAGNNIIPRIEKILVGVGEAVAKLAPILGEQVPAIVVSVLPTMLDAGTQLFLGLVTGIINALPNLVAAVPTIIETFITTIAENLPAIVASGQTLLSMFSGGIMSGIPAMLEQLPQVIDSILNFITENLPDVLGKGVETLNKFVTGIINGIPNMLLQLPKIITSFVKFIVTNLPVIAKAGMDILANLATGIIDNLPQIGFAVGKIIASVISGIKDLLGSVIGVGNDIVRGIWDGIVGMADWIKEKVSGFFGGIVDGVKDFLGIHSPSRVFAGIGENMALGVGKGWDSEFIKVKKDVENGLNFGTATVDFASSSVGISTAGMVNGINAGVNQSSVMAPITFKLVLPSGVELATYLLDPLTAVANANGMPILNPV